MRRTFITQFLYIVIAAGLVAGGALLLWLSTLTVPDLSNFDERKVAQSTKIYDRTGEILLYDVHENIRRTVVPSEEISHNIKNATVAIEDDTFYEHRGVRPLAVVRAVLQNLLDGDLLGGQGGSTITQQVVKNALLTPEKTITRKLKEWFLAFRLEEKLTKDEILEIYLNETPYGGNIYGIEEAAQAYFAKPSSDLSVAESAYLAALPQAPTYYSPYGNNVEQLERRKNIVLDRMLSGGFLTREEYEEAKKAKVDFQPRSELGIRAPHFVFHILEQLERDYGQRAVEEQGLRVISTLDWELQEKAQGIVREFALKNEEQFNAENAGLVAIDPKTGGVLTMVGSRDYFDENIDGNFNVATANRQPGSAFKPIVYAAALQKGYTPETVVFDVPTQFSTACSPTDLRNEGICYAPVNYDDSFRGPMTFREALAQSVNVPAVKVLYLAGLRDSISLARDVGIETLTDASRYGLTLVLGGGEVTLLDLTSAYSVFANEGTRHPHVSILRIEDNSGRLIFEHEEKPMRVLPENIARHISDILSDNVARTPLYGPNSQLYFGGRDVAAKTGTTNDFRDAWTVGYTPSIAVGAWAGNNDNRSMEKRISGLIITPLWRAFMDEALKKFPAEPFTPPLPDDPETLKPVLAGVWQISKDGEKEGNEVRSILHWVERDNPRGPVPAHPGRDPQYHLWETGVKNWLTTQSIVPRGNEVEEGDPGKVPVIQIVTPAAGSMVRAHESVIVTLSNVRGVPIRRVDYFVGDIPVGSSSILPFTHAFTPADHALSPGSQELRARATSISGASGEARVQITIE